MNKLYSFVNSLKYSAVWEINGADFISLIPVEKLAIERNCEADFVTNSKRRLTEKIGLRHNFHRSEGNTQKKERECAKKVTIIFTNECLQTINNKSDFNPHKIPYKIDSMNKFHM